MTKNYRSEASSVIHDLAESLYRYNIIDKVAMREIDESCLISSSELSAEDIRERRLVSPSNISPTESVQHE